MSHKNAYFYVSLITLIYDNLFHITVELFLIKQFGSVMPCTILPLASLDKSSVVRDMTEISTFFRSCLSFIVNNVNTTAGITDGTTTLYATESAVNQHEYQTPFILW